MTPLHLARRPHRTGTLAFRAAGLPFESFTPVEPTWSPKDFADTRAAWEGPLPDAPGIRVRLEAAALPRQDHLDLHRRPVVARAGHAAARAIDVEQRAHVFSRPGCGSSSSSADCCWRGTTCARTGADRRSAARLVAVYLIVDAVAWIVGGITIVGSAGDQQLLPGDRQHPVNAACCGYVPRDRAVRAPILAGRTAGMDAAVLGTRPRPAHRARDPDRLRVGRRPHDPRRAARPGAEPDRPSRWHTRLRQRGQRVERRGQFCPELGRSGFGSIQTAFIVVLVFVGLRMRRTPHVAGDRRIGVILVTLSGDAGAAGGICLDCTRSFSC